MITKIKYLGIKHKYLEEVKQISVNEHIVLHINENNKQRFHCGRCFEELSVTKTSISKDDFVNMKNKLISENKMSYRFIRYNPNIDKDTFLIRFYCKKCNIHTFMCLCDIQICIDRYDLQKYKQILHLKKIPDDNRPILNNEYYVDEFKCDTFKKGEYPNNETIEGFLKLNIYQINRFHFTTIDKYLFIKDKTHKIFGIYLYKTITQVFYNLKTKKHTFVKKHFITQYRYYGNTKTWAILNKICKNGFYVPMNKKEIQKYNFETKGYNSESIHCFFQGMTTYVQLPNSDIFFDFFIKCLFEMGLQPIDYKTILQDKEIPDEYKCRKVTEKELIYLNLFNNAVIPELTVEDKISLRLQKKKKNDDIIVPYVKKYISYIKKESKEGRDAFFKKIDVLPHTKKAKQLINESLAYAVVYKKMKELGFKNLDLFYQLCDSLGMGTQNPIFIRKEGFAIYRLIRMFYDYPSTRFFKTYFKYAKENKIINEIKKNNSEILCDTINMYNQLYSKGYSKLLITAGGKSIFTLPLKEIHDEISRIFTRIRDDKTLDVALSSQKQTELSNIYNYNGDKYKFSVITENLKLIEIGQVMNICVGSYGGRVNNHSCNIVSVVKNDNIYAACIELDGSGKSICQAKGYRNNYLHENTHHVVTQWIEDHKLKIKTEDLEKILKSATNQRECDYHIKEIAQVNMIPEKF